MSATVSLGPAEMREVLSDVLAQVHGPDSCLLGWDVGPLSKRGKHRVVRYDLQARVAGAHEVQHFQWVGKFYERGEDARAVVATLRAVASAGGARDGLIVPAVLAYHAPRRLLLMTYEAGQTVVSAIAQYNGLVSAAVGRALAALHAVAPPVTLERITPSAAVLDDLRGRVSGLIARFPEDETHLRHALRELERAVPPLPATPSFLHGDLGPAQLRWRSGSVVFLDFDDCTRGDPALDLGNLLTQVRRLTVRRPGKLPDFGSVHRGILDAYTRLAPPDPGLPERVRWYERAALVRKIHFLAFDTTRHKEVEAIRQRRAEAIRLLDELRGSEQHGV